MTKPGLKEKGSLLGKPFISYSSLTRRIQCHSLTSSNSQAGKDTKRRGKKSWIRRMGRHWVSGRIQRSVRDLKVRGRVLMEWSQSQKQNKKPFPCFMVNCETVFKASCYLFTGWYLSISLSGAYQTLAFLIFSCLTFNCL